MTPQHGRDTGRLPPYFQVFCSLFLVGLYVCKQWYTLLMYFM